MAESKFKEHGLIPLVANTAPDGVLQVKFPSGVEASLGNELTPRQVKDKPDVTWTADEKELYTLCMTDPDTPGGIANPGTKNTGWKHFLVVNIPGNKVGQGDVMADYVECGPLKDTGNHRYVFLLYKQPGKITPEGCPSSSLQIRGRRKFTVQAFAEKHSLGEPVAGNFFLAAYDDYVPEKQKKFYTVGNIFTYFTGGSVSK
ncbi:putative OV-16 antigen [Hypsibius exemplaris]|uniref:OV-16 antigen n=1 Tax=Hypsibius exemplaris TaxID=2072580 RepID=A0A1W0WV22_HYPEX|nr:putative OV-16 antigen [Hypsibius exemplaris]